MSVDARTLSAAPPARLTILSEKRRAFLVLNGVGLLISALLSGWLYFFYLLGSIELWPFINEAPAAIPGDRRAWNMAHMEGITQGLLLIGLAASAPYMRLTPRAWSWLFYATLTFTWLFTLPAIANAWFETRGLAFDNGPFPGDRLTNNIIFLSGWPAMIGVHIGLPLFALGAWNGFRAIADDA